MYSPASFVSPSGELSVAEIRTKTGFSGERVERVMSMISMARRMRFCRLPPYLSVRLFEMGERNSWSCCRGEGEGEDQLQVRTRETR